MKISLRQATKQDLPEVLSMIKELALYEKAPQEVTVTLEELERDGFSERPVSPPLSPSRRTLEDQIFLHQFYFLRGSRASISSTVWARGNFSKRLFK